MKRSHLRAKTADTSTAKLRKPKCKGCGERKEPFRPFAEVCSPACAETYVLLTREKEARAAAKRVLAEDRERKEKIKSRSEHIAELQVIFNRFIRARDIAAGHNCIDCDKPFEPGKPGGSIDAGHYLARSVAPHLRFDERNVFAQRKNCNMPGGTTRAAFRAGVERRIGTEALEALEADQEPRKWNIPELVAMKALYRAKLKELKQCA